MAKFLNTSATNFYLEELIKNASDRLILISPFLKLSERIKELLIDKNSLKIDVRIVYGKNELHPNEISWLHDLQYIRTSFCKNLHAKCYLNEESCIITSLNLYEFSQINNNEMGIALNRSDDAELYRDAYEESQRIIRISEEVRMSLDDKVVREKASTSLVKREESPVGKLTTSKLAQKLSVSTQELLEKLVMAGYLTTKDGKHYITDSGKACGGEFRMGKQFGAYFLWPADLKMD